MKTIQPNTTQLRMLASVKSQQWLMNPNEVQNFALAALEAEDRTNKADSDLALFYDMRKPMSIDADGIAHIEIKGSLLYNCPPIYEKLGLAVRYETIINEVKLAEASGAKGILYNVSSPGGTVAGVIEASEVMNDSPLPSSSYCSGMACSAGYWLACSADTIIASPSAQVGNVGAIRSWQDCSAFWADQGIEFKALVLRARITNQLSTLNLMQIKSSFCKNRLTNQASNFGTMYQLPAQTLMKRYLKRAGIAERGLVNLA